MLRIWHTLNELWHIGEAFAFTCLCRVCFWPKNDKNNNKKERDAKYKKYPVIKNIHVSM